MKLKRQNECSVPGDAKVYAMKMEEFRSGREEVERIIDGVEEEIKAKFVLEPDKKIKQAQDIVDGLAKEASEGVQARSVHNMNVNINILKEKVEKLPVRKAPVQKKTRKK